MDKYTTQQLLTALLERTTFTNGLDFCSARDICSLMDALNDAMAIPPLPEPYAPFGEPLLQVLVHLCSGDDTMMDDDTFYAMLDAQTTDEAEYYCECNDAVYFPAYNALGASRA